MPPPTLLQKKNNAKLYVDDESGFYKRYKYELHNFNISAPIVEKQSKFLGFFGKIRRRIFIKLSRLNPSTKFLIEEKDKNKLCSYNAEQFNVNFDKNLYFEGYFQSEKYYNPYIDNLLREFSFKNNITNEKNHLVDNIKKSNSVSIHLRQDKFLPDENHENLDKLNLEFMNNNILSIKKGIKYFDEKLDNPQYFVWSKNFSGITSHFDSKRFTLVNRNFNKDPAHDLYLMSLCKHFILSPSSMHYWGALLSKNDKKMCLSPPYIKNKSGYYGFSNNKGIKADWWKEI